jgi:hypothetical protein
MQCFGTLHKGDENVDNERAYRSLFNRFAQSDDKFDEEWVEEFEEAIIEEGEVVATHSWDSDNPGAGAGMTLIYRVQGLFFTSTDFGLDGPYEEFSEAAEAVGLLAVTETTEKFGWTTRSIRTQELLAMTVTMTELDS